MRSLPPRGAHEENRGDSAPDVVPPLVRHGRPAPLRAHNYGRGRPGAREAVQQANGCGRRCDDRCGLRDLSAVVGGPKLVAPRVEAFSAASRYTLLLYGLSSMKKKRFALAIDPRLGKCASVQ